MKLSRNAKIWLALLVAGTSLRFATQSTFHAPAGDGIEYHKLAHELRRAGRYAYSPDKLTFARMPGYPVFLALVVENAAPNDLNAVILNGTRWNILFDLGTAIFFFLAIAETGRRREAWLAYILLLFCPLLILNCCYLLRESLATFLTTVTVYLLIRTLQRKEAWPLCVGGALVGLTILIRPDAFLLGLAFVVPWLALRGWRRRASTAAIALAACLVVFSPWPIRNQLRFGDPHPWGTNWTDPSNGDPFPTGIREWMRTWIDGLHEGWLHLRLTLRLPIVPDRDLHVRAYDTPAEKAEVSALLLRWNREGVSPAVDQGFRDLAWKRLREHPIRTAIWLPIRRAATWWWWFTPPEEQPLNAWFLGQPQGRWIFEGFSHTYAILGLLGWLLLARRRETRALAAFLGIALLVRSVAMSVLSPDGCQRYLSPVYPLLLWCVATFLLAVYDRWDRWKQRRS